MSVAPAIHIAQPAPLLWRAGKRARRQIAECGLQAADVALLPGAAGGPKALALTGLDQAIFADWLPQAPRQRQLIGSSIGAWRFVCAMQADPRRAIANLAERYTQETYAPGVTAADIGIALRAMLADLFQQAPADLLAHPDYQLTLTTVRARGPLASERPAAQLAGVAAAATLNLVSRQAYARCWERVWFADPRSDMAALCTDFPTRIVPLHADNIGDALSATAAIPLVVSGVRDPHLAPQGQYRDGGLIDYHLDLPYPAVDGLVLYPHFFPRLVPGWFDKALPWRRPAPARLDNVVLLTPSPEWVAALPHGKIPDRKDFQHFDDATRQRQWRQVVGETQRLGDAFLRSVGNEALHTQVQPF